MQEEPPGQLDTQVVASVDHNFKRLKTLISFLMNRSEGWYIVQLLNNLVPSFMASQVKEKSHKKGFDLYLVFPQEHDMNTGLS